MTAHVLHEFLLHTTSRVVHRHDCASIRSVPRRRLRAIDADGLEYARACPNCLRIASADRRGPRRAGELDPERAEFLRCRELARDVTAVLELLRVPYRDLGALLAQFDRGATVEQFEQLARMIARAARRGDGRQQDPAK
jgi:hypothetical protein